MQVGKLFDLTNDVRDVLDFFEAVDNREQLVSRLERLKRQGTDDLYACLEGMRASLTALLADVLEMSASIDQEIGDDESAAEGESAPVLETELDRQLEELGKELLGDGEVAASTDETPVASPEASSTVEKPSETSSPE